MTPRGKPFGSLWRPLPTSDPALDPAPVGRLRFHFTVAGLTRLVSGRSWTGSQGGSIGEPLRVTTDGCTTKGFP